MDERSQDVDWLDDPFERAYTTAVLDADPIPPREVVIAAVAFGNLYNLPELSEALKRARAERLRSR